MFDPSHRLPYMPSNMMMGPPGMVFLMLAILDPPWLPILIF
jgi:hypothetical protein